MSTPELHVREAGQGPGVVCLHANASSSSQWRELLERLAPHHHVLAPDAYGAGRSPEWPSDRVIALDDEVALIAPVLARAGTPFSLVGHSYGGAVALKAALAHRPRLQALALYEPTLFALVETTPPAPNDAAGIHDAVAAAAAALDAGDRDTAARCFIDYWMGPGSLASAPPERQAAMAASVVNVRRWAHALTTEPTPLDAFRALDLPVLLMVGARSTAAAHAVARRLASALPRVEWLEFPDLGHMGPVTHPQRVNDAIADFLARCGA